MKYNKDIRSVILNRMYYISHPAVSTLECAINLESICFGSDDLFEQISEEVVKIGNFNLKEIIVKEEVQTLIFKDVSAMKLLNILFKGNEDHALYPIYLKWIGGLEWMKTSF